jgi:hypothetical protein
VPPIDPSTVDGLTVRYVLDVGADRIDEADSMLQFDDYAASIRSARYCEGAVILAAEGQESLALNDALPFLVKELCFRSMRPLSDGKSVTVPFFMTGVDVVASVHGGQIELSLTLGGSFHFEKRSMMNALFQCGRRFTAFHSRLWAGLPDHRLDVANLEQECADAAQVLASAARSG